MDSTNLVRTQVEDNVELFYFKDSGLTGIHLRGLATKLDNCNPATISRVLGTVTQNGVLTLEMPTAQGLRTVTVVLESVLPEVLIAIMRGNYKQSTVDAAEKLLKKFAQFGFKLQAMFQTAPEELAKAIGFTTPVPDDELTRFTLVDAQIKRCIAIAGKPGLPAVQAYKTMFGSAAPTRQSETKTSAPAIKSKQRAQAEQDELVMARIIELSRKKGPITARAARQGLSKSIPLTCTQIRWMFNRMVDEGKGRIFGDGQSTAFIAD